MDSLVCPKGHVSIDHDYCSECGAKIVNGNGSAATPAVAAAANLEVCPDCGTMREHKGVTFCEICGYNFMTGARGEVPVNFSGGPAEAAFEASLDGASLDRALLNQAPLDETSMDQALLDQASMYQAPLDPEPLVEAAGATRAAWTAVVSVDESAKLPDSPDAPSGVAEFTVELSKPVTLIGRTSQTRAIFPEIAIDYDDAVSHRHALLQFDADGGLVVRDIGAANGTQVNGEEIAPMADYALKDGDQITLGHWSRISVKAAE